MVKGNVTHRRQFCVIGAQRARRKSEMQLYWNLPFGSASLLSTQFAPCYSQSCHEPPRLRSSSASCAPAKAIRLTFCCCGCGERVCVLCVFSIPTPIIGKFPRKSRPPLQGNSRGGRVKRRAAHSTKLFIYLSRRGVIRAAPR